MASLAWTTFFVAVWGCATAIAVLKVGSPIRIALAEVPVLKYLVVCPACLSFWIAVAASFVWSPSAHSGFPDGWSHVFDGFTALAVSWFLHVVTARVMPDDL